MRRGERLEGWGVGYPPGGFHDARGDLAAERAILLALAGGHRVLLVGQPGSNLDGLVAWARKLARRVAVESVPDSDGMGSEPGRRRGVARRGGGSPPGAPG